MGKIALYDDNNSDNNTNWPARTSSIQLPLKQEVPGITGLSNLSRKSADGPH